MYRGRWHERSNEMIVYLIYADTNALVLRWVSLDVVYIAISWIVIARLEFVERNIGPQVESVQQW